MKALYQSLSSKITLFAMIVIFVTMSIVTLIVYYTSYNNFSELSLTKINNDTDLISSELENIFTNLRDDLTILSKTPPIKGIIRAQENEGFDPIEKSTDDEWKNRLAMIFQSMLEVKENYTQIRYIGIDSDGKEIVRLNRREGNIYRTPQEALQSKIKRSYVQKGIRHESGSVLFSEISYNKENDQLQYPLTLTLRALMPIYNDKLEVFGLLIINVNIEKYIQSILEKHINDYNLYLFTPTYDLFHYKAESKSLSFFQNTDSLKDINSPQTPKALFKTLSKNEDLTHLKKAIYADQEKNQQPFTLFMNKADSTISNSEFVSVSDFIQVVIAIGILATLLIYFFTKKVTRHLSSMADQISYIYSNKEKTVKLPTHLNDEVGILARALENKTKMLEKLALFDSLTGMPNRKNLLDHLDESLCRAKRRLKTLALIFLDINDFKEINDSYGHEYGDELLKQFAARIKNIIRNSEFCARLGGDEFAILIEDIEDDNEVQGFINRYEQALNGTYNIKGITLHMSISGGVALYPDDALNSNELLSESDKAMYQSKIHKAGRIILISSA